MIDNIHSFSNYLGNLSITSIRSGFYKELLKDLRNHCRIPNFQITVVLYDLMIHMHRDMDDYNYFVVAIILKRRNKNFSKQLKIFTKWKKNVIIKKIRRLKSFW